MLAEVEATYNGITVGEDDAVYYTDQSSGQVFRVALADGTKTQVTDPNKKVTEANGLAFGPDKQLYVLSWTDPGVVTRIKLENNVEVSREPYVTLPTGKADGIAFDKQGNLYVTSGALWKITPDKQVTKVNPSGSANIDFGAGALSCAELLFADGERPAGGGEHHRGDGRAVAPAVMCSVANSRPVRPRPD